MNIKLHAVVDCSDGRAGHVTGAVVEPRDQTITHLVIKMHGTEYIVPLSMVKDQTDEALTLSFTKEQLRAQQPFIETDYVRTPVDSVEFLPGYTAYARNTDAEMVPVERENLPFGEVEIRIGMPVYSKNGTHVGHVDEIALDPQSGRFTHFLMAHRQLLSEKGYVVGSWQLKSITEDGIYLKTDDQEVRQLPTMALKHHA
ncbi:MAG: PRC-barrel domain-containing protein [Anaerolineae bacterium]|nr:PRC-barrel domain-containing protein [Anaerolineae bacterium]